MPSTCSTRESLRWMVAGSRPASRRRGCDCATRTTASACSRSAPAPTRWPVSARRAAPAAGREQGRGGPGRDEQGRDERRRSGPGRGERGRGGPGRHGPGLAAEALAQVLRFDAPADLVLRRFFAAHPQMGRRDRGELAESVFDVLRNRRLYAHLAQSGEGTIEQRLLALSRVGATIDASRACAGGAAEPAGLARTRACRRARRCRGGDELARRCWRRRRWTCA